MLLVLSQPTSFMETEISTVYEADSLRRRGNITTYEDFSVAYLPYRSPLQTRGLSGESEGSNRIKGKSLKTLPSDESLFKFGQLSNH